MFSLTNMPSTTSVLSTYTTFAASAMLVRTVLNEVQNMTNQFIPQKLREKIISKLESLSGNFSSQMVIIDEYNGFTINEIYEACEVYLSTRITRSVEQIKVSQAPKEKTLSVTINKGQKMADTFENIQLTWEFISIETQKTVPDWDSGCSSTETSERKSVHLSFHKRDKDKVLNYYIPHIVERSKAIKEKKKVVKLHSLGSYSASVNLDHPSTFDTLAMDPTMKKELIDDLDRFVRRREFYKRVGKAWKRGYLLYGPPGTGKSSLIAAMANYLKFDVYDLELSSLGSNAQLRNLLLSTGNRSILVIEDIDCSIELENRECGGGYGQSDSKLTLSGLLNFVDGLWSSCGDERIIVFSTNYKERLDSALLRPGRMDMHIHLSYLTPSGFKILALNYLEIESHSLFGEIEEMIKEVEVTPAEVAEELMKSDDADIVLRGLVEFLGKKKEEMMIKKCNESKVDEEHKIEEEERKVVEVVKKKRRIAKKGNDRRLRSRK